MNRCGLNRYFGTVAKRVACIVTAVILLLNSGTINVIISILNNVHTTQNFVLDNVDNGRSNIQAVVKPQREADRFRNITRICKATPEKLIGDVPFANEPPDMKITELLNPEVKDGSYEVMTCKSHYRIAIIVPLRGRLKNFGHLLSHMHPIWQRQELSYTVFAITQAGTGTFNKAKLMNAGFKEARSYGNYDCFVFHDVDALLEDDRCLYWCNRGNPRHLCVYADVFQYKVFSYYAECRVPQDYLFRTKLFGGVTMFTADEFMRINGFSNYYWGWGGEDDDMYRRLVNEGFDIQNPHGRHCSYTLLKHTDATLNVAAGPKDTLIYHATARQHKDGLNNVRYKVLSYEHKPLYVNITVDVGTPTKQMQDFLDIKMKYAWFSNICTLRVPWNI